MQIKCENCVYYLPIEHDESKTLDYGECRRFPRQPMGVATDDDIAYSTYPIQQHDDWCGEFQKINEKDFN